MIPIIFRSLNFYGFKTIFLSAIETVEFAKLAGNFIGFRSGLCDVVLALSDIKALVVFPNTIRIASEEYLNSCSIKKMYEKDTVDEIIYTNDEELITSVTSIFEKREIHSQRDISSVMPLEEAHTVVEALNDWHG